MNTAKGVMIMVLTHMPKNMEMLPSRAIFMLEVLMTYHTMKMMTEMTVGRPRPPLRMMAPSGAPMKKKSRQASESVIFWCHSTQWRRMELSVSSVDMPFHSNSERRART